MPKRLLCVAVVLALVFAASMAFAYPTVQLKFATVANNTTTNIYDPTQNKNLGVYTGNYIVDIDWGSGFTPVSGYCVDPTNSSTKSLPYLMVPIPDLQTAFGASTRFLQGYQAAAWILSQGYSSKPASAIAQVAVWELTWDYALGNPIDLTAGNFRLNSGVSDSDVLTLIGLAQAAVGTGFTGANAYLAINPTDENPTTGWYAAQDYIVPTPLPGAMLLLGAGLLRLVSYGRRQKGLA